MPETSPKPSLATLVTRLSTISELAIGEHLLRRDPLAKKVPAQLRGSYIAGAIACGVSEGAQVGELLRAQGLSVPEYLATQGVVIRDAPAAGWTGYVQLAQYFPKGSGGLIELAGEPIAALERLMGDSDLWFTLPTHAPRVLDVVLAHELFHHIETHCPDVFTQATKVTAWEFGRFRRTKALKGLSEIAATAFAQRLTGLSYSPHLLTIIAGAARDLEFGNLILAELLEIQTNIGG